jgi:hypothetical protein
VGSDARPGSKRLPLRLPRVRRLATGAAAFWVGTVAYTLSTVIIIAVVGRGSGQGGFEGLTAVLALLSVGSVVPVAVMLRTAAVVADGEAVPRLSSWLLRGFVVAGLALAPLSGAVLHVPAAAIPLMVLQLLIALPLANRRGVFLAARHFSDLGINLSVEAAVRIVLASLLGLTLGVTGVAVGCCLGTVVAVVLLPSRSVGALTTGRPVTSLLHTSLALVLVSLFVQLDVLLAPSGLSTAAAKRFDVAAIPSKGVYLVLLAAGPIVFPFVRQSGRRRLVGLATAGTVAIGCVATAVLVAARPLIGKTLGQAAPSASLLWTLGAAMALGGGTAVLMNAAVARGIERPWPAVALAILGLIAYSRSRPGPVSFAVAVLLAQAAAVSLSAVATLHWAPLAHRRKSPVNLATDPPAAPEPWPGGPD